MVEILFPKKLFDKKLSIPPKERSKFNPYPKTDKLHKFFYYMPSHFMTEMCHPKYEPFLRWVLEQYEKNLAKKEREWFEYFKRAGSVKTVVIQNNKDFYFKWIRTLPKYRLRPTGWGLMIRLYVADAIGLPRDEARKIYKDWLKESEKVEVISDDGQDKEAKV